MDPDCTLPTPVNKTNIQGRGVGQFQKLPVEWIFGQMKYDRPYKNFLPNKI